MVAALPPTSLTVPVADADGTYAVSWSKSATNGVLYVLEEATDSNFTNSHTVYSGTELNAIISRRSSGVTYYYRVKATLADYTDSAWVNGGNGCVVMIPAGAPGTLTVPASDVDGVYTVSWTTSNTIGISYVLEEATNSDFTAGLRTAYSGIALNAVISGRTIGVTYYYRVKATLSGYTDSVWVNGGNGCFVTPKVMVGTKPFSTLQFAYDDAATTTGSIIKLLEGTFVNSLTASKSISVKLEGGYNATYDAVSTETTIQGPLKVRSGTVRMKGVKVR